MSRLTRHNTAAAVLVGEVVACGRGDAGTIRCLLLRAKAHTGRGVLAGTGYSVPDR